MTIDEATAAHWRPAHNGAFALMTDPTTPPEEPSWNVPTSADFAFRLLDPALTDVAGGGHAVLGRRLGARRRLVPAGGPVRVHARPAAVHRGDRDPRPVPQRRLQRPRRDGRHGRQPAAGRPADRPADGAVVGDQPGLGRGEPIPAGPRDRRPGARHPVGRAVGTRRPEVRRRATPTRTDGQRPPERDAARLEVVPDDAGGRDAGPGSG